MSNSDAGGPFAVVDLGTNTFHLLVGRWKNGVLEVVYRERHFVKLAAEGITTLGTSSISRARNAAESLGRAIRLQSPQRAVAYGTAALRTASNGPTVRQELADLLGLNIQLIDGHREAELISLGVRAAKPPVDEYLIMDIGGGSVEFIQVQEDTIRFRESYPLGAQVLRTRFHTAEPFGKTQSKVLFEFLDETLQEVRAQFTDQLVLIGASGTFDVLGDLYGAELQPGLHEIDPNAVTALYEESTAMTADQRLQDPRLPPDRADMIVVALALIEHFIRAFPGLRIITCAYALKEGALVELSRN